MQSNENILGSEKMSIERALWLYGFMALWLYGFMALWLYGFMALWLYGFIKKIEIYFYCIEIAINSNIPKKEKLFCSNKFFREKLFIFNCEWKFIAEKIFSAYFQELK
jgi:hypothetical protein